MRNSPTHWGYLWSQAEICAQDLSPTRLFALAQPSPQNLHPHTQCLPIPIFLQTTLALLTLLFFKDLCCLLIDCPLCKLGGASVITCILKTIKAGYVHSVTCPPLQRLPCIESKHLPTYLLPNFSTDPPGLWTLSFLGIWRGNWKCGLRRDSKVTLPGARGLPHFPRLCSSPPWHLWQLALGCKVPCEAKSPLIIRHASPAADSRPKRRSGCSLQFVIPLLTG